MKATNRIMIPLAALLLSALATTRAIASEGAEGGGSTLFTGDLGNMLWTLITFVAVLLVLGKFAWGPILSALQKREDFIRDSLEKAKKDRDDAEARLKEYADKIASARDEATAIVEEGRSDGDALRAKIEGAARTEAQAMLERAKRELGLAKDTAVSELYELSGKLATDIASRIIRKELNSADHERLISESIAELSSAVASGNGKN